MSNITFQTDTDGVATITIDVADRTQNIFTPGFVSEMAEAIATLAGDEALKGAIITSGKPGGFMAGADLKDVLRVHDEGVTAIEAAALFEDANKLMRSIETCGKPVVAAINGFALGGGMELALACHHRILLDAPGASMGLPEVTLGLLPAGGGTQRLPRMLGIPAALTYLLQGSPAKPAKALADGICDALADTPEAMMAAAKDWILANPEAVKPWDIRGFKVPGGAGPLAPHAMSSFMAGTAKIKGHQLNYPAQKAILSAVFEGTQVPFDLAMKIESDWFGTLLSDPVSGNLVRSFMRNTEARKAARGDGSEHEVKKLGVLGAGMMGAGIVHVSARAGIEVVLIDRTEEAAAKGLAHITRQCARDIEKGRLTQAKADEILSCVTATADYAALQGADLIVEAVFESRAVKAEVAGKSEDKLVEGGVFASNTSTLPITSLAENLTDPTRFIGLHFFSPVERMPLVEVILGEKTSDSTLKTALAYVARLNKTPILVHDSPGFYTSRVFCTYIDEAMAMLAEGISPALIENAARIGGFPTSPLAVTDEVSLDLQKLVIDQAIDDGLDARFLREHAQPVVIKMNELGRLGRKTKAGFYDHPGDATKRLWPGLAEVFPVRAAQPPVEEVRDRLLYIQALESARCLAEGVIDDEATADIGSVLGIGFPAWTGGALSLISIVGAQAFFARCEAFAQSVGPRFKPSDAVTKLAAEKAGEARKRAA